MFTYILRTVNSCNERSLYQEYYIDSWLYTPIARNGCHFDFFYMLGNKRIYDKDSSSKNKLLYTIFTIRGIRI